MGVLDAPPQHQAGTATSSGASGWQPTAHSGDLTGKNIPEQGVLAWTWTACRAMPPNIVIYYLLLTMLGVGGSTAAYSNAHWFSLRISSSSAGVKSFWMLNTFRISSGVFPLIMLATFSHVSSSRSLMSR